MIAISYRRDDSLPMAGRLYDRLQAKFGKRNVFMDFDSIPPGTDFRQQIKQTIQNSSLVIAIIGPKWIGECADSSRRIDDPTDFVCLEIAYALESGIPIIPLLLNNTKMPESGSLPPAIRELAFRHALPLDSGMDFHYHADRVINSICSLVDLGGEDDHDKGQSPSAAVPLALSPTKRLTVLGLAIAIGAAAVLFTWYFAAHQQVTTSAVDRSRSKGDTSKAAPPQSEPAFIPEKSIAVLPFENRSGDKANDYLAEGIQDEILTRLSKIANLMVISRTSTQHYTSAPENLPEIARQLGVAHILEGSVQKSGSAVRVNVKLIKAANDSHLWADTFDRKLTDIFSVESEIAKAIAEQLRVHLSGREEQVIAAKPTDNPDAYDAYLRGLAYTLKAANTSANALGAQKYLREAVRLDPKFALSWALLSYVDALGYLTQSIQPTLALREEARQAAETALALQPNLGEAVLAQGYYHYSCLKDYDTALHYFEQARQLLPNSSRVPESLAYIARRRAKWDESETYFNEAERLDPRDANLLTQQAGFYVALRRFPEALRKLDQVLDITPDDLDTLALKAGIAQAEGDLPRAAALLAPLHPAAENTNALETQVYQTILERHPAQIIPRLKEILAKPDPALGYYNGELRFWLGWAQEVARDHAGAQESWRQARSELESFLKEQPDNYGLIGDLALINMGVGDKRAALAMAERAMAVIPIEKDSFDGPAPVEVFARVAAQVGEPDRAIAAVQKLRSIPYEAPLGSAVPLTPALLRLDPMFDPLRNDPRFQKLAASSAPK